MLDHLYHLKFILESCTCTKTYVMCIFKKRLDSHIFPLFLAIKIYMYMCVVLHIVCGCNSRNKRHIYKANVITFKKEHLNTTQHPKCLFIKLTVHNTTWYKNKTFNRHSPVPHMKLISVMMWGKIITCLTVSKSKQWLSFLCRLFLSTEAL